MKRLISCALVLLAALTVFADDLRRPLTAAPVQEEKKPNMFPFAKGSQWEFDLTISGMTLSITQEMTDVSKKGDQTHATLTTKVNGQDITEEMSSDDKGIYRHSMNNMKLDKPILTFKYPVQPQKWTDTFKIQGMEVEAKMEMKAAEDVTVPAGTYKKVVPVVISMTVQGQEVVATNYYADGVGIIKQDADFAGTKISSQLKRYTAGK